MNTRRGRGVPTEKGLKSALRVSKIISPCVDNPESVARINRAFASLRVSVYEESRKKQEGLYEHTERGATHGEQI